MTLDSDVLKAGGWSVETPEKTDAAISFLNDNPQGRIVLTSAPKGMTNLLLKAAHERILEGSTTRSTFDQIMKVWENLCLNLGTHENYAIIKQDLIGELAQYNGPRSVESIAAKWFIDRIASRGEYFEARYIFAPRANARGLPAFFQDTRGILIGSENPGDSDIEPETDANLRREVLEKGIYRDRVVVMPSWMLHAKDGKTVVMARNKGDVPPSYIAGRLKAKRYLNLTNRYDKKGGPSISPRAFDS